MHHWLDNCPTRVKAVIASSLASLPLFLVAVPSGWTRALAGAVVSITLGAWLFALINRAPQRRLMGAILAWRAGNRFVATDARLPSEYAVLATAIQLATDRLSDREVDLRAAIEQQSLAMQEIHHRVKNNLQIVASLLNLQASRITVPAAQAEFQSARDRVKALATLHRHLYAHGGLHTINLREFLTELCGQLFSALGETPGNRIDLHVDAPALEISSDQAVPLALIVTEAVSNAVKFAFPRGRRGRVDILLTADGDDLALVVADDGVGIESGQGGEAAVEGRRDGIGLQLIRGFARQLGGTLQVEDEEGTRYVVRMKLRRDRPVVSAKGVAGLRAREEA